MKEISIPSFVTNGNATTLYREEENYFDTATQTQKHGLLSDIKYILDTIRRFGMPKKLKFRCQMVYDNGKKINIKR